MYAARLRNEGAQLGNMKDYPLYLDIPTEAENNGIKYLKYKRRKISNEKELHKIVDEYLSDAIHKKKELKVSLGELGIEPIMLLDERTLKLLELYDYYSSNATPPAPFDNQVWFDTVSLMERLRPRL